MSDSQLTIFLETAVFVRNVIQIYKDKKCNFGDCEVGATQGCINRSILPSGMGARGVSSEHVENMENAEKMENMEMFSGSPLRCSPVLQLRCAPVLREPCSN